MWNFQVFFIRRSDFWWREAGLSRRASTSYIVLSAALFCSNAFFNCVSQCPTYYSQILTLGAGRCFFLLYAFHVCFFICFFLRVIFCYIDLYHFHEKCETAIIFTSLPVGRLPICLSWRSQLKKLTAITFGIQAEVGWKVTCVHLTCLVVHWFCNKSLREVKFERMLRFCWSIFHLKELSRCISLICFCFLSSFDVLKSLAIPPDMVKKCCLWKILRSLVVSMFTEKIGWFPSNPGWLLNHSCHDCAGRHTHCTSGRSCEKAALSGIFFPAERLLRWLVKCAPNH